MRMMLTIIAGLLALPAATAPGGPTAKIDTGIVQGTTAGGLEVFKGIPYATPPIGNLRWRAPAAAAPWQGVREATAFGPDCVHDRRDWEADRNGAPMSEDCLYLNVWTPAKRLKAGAPVMLWIHGGSFTAGSGSQAIYDGASLAARGVVVVTINYRLGRFGFFAHPALTAESPNSPTGNWGLMDMTAALQWVHRNIAAFGGDPKNVTIFGESAGGGAVNTLMTMPSVRGLFQRAIAESGGGRDDGVPLTVAEQKGEAFAKGAGIDGNDLKALRAIPADKVKGSMTLTNTEAATYSGPMIDGRLVTDRIDAVFRAGKQAPVPYLAGGNSYEIGFVPAPLRGAFTAIIGKSLGDAQPGVLAAYGSQQAYDHSVASDAVFNEPARAVAGWNAANTSYLYQFDYVPTSKRGTSPGAEHGSEVPFVFGTIDAAGYAVSDEDRKMATLIGDYWVAFAKGGNPNGSGRPLWPRYQPSNPSRLVFSSKGAEAASAALPALDALAKVADAKRAASPKP